jgi:hypothetical protein
MAISKVVVVDGNNLIVRIDRGVAGRGVTDVEPVEIDGSLYLVFTFSDGTTETVGPVGTIQYIGQAPIVVTGSTISLNTVPVAKGGTGQVTANAGFNALAPTQTGNSGKYLKTDGTNSAWDLLDISTADITGVLPLANGGTASSTASGARTNLGLGTIATQDASNVSITGGTITGITDLAVADGGTGASTASGARTNLNAVDQALTLTAGTGLSGGGDLTANRSFSITNTGVTATAYGAASKTLTATVNAQGQLTVLADTPIAIANTQISGLGTMSTQNANAVAITGGSITGITDLAVADGGTGASDAAGARTNLNAANQATTITAGTGLSGGGDLSANRTINIANTTVTAGAFGSASNTLTATVNAQGQLTALAATPIAIANTQVSGLGTMSTQNSNAVTITGGSITGITDLALADGGTGASNAPDARSNLGLGSAAVLNAGVALGVATLDAGGTVPLSQIPASIQGGVSYQGAWNASTNTPTLVSSVGSKGYYYVVSVAGNTNLNGVTDWLVGDWAIYNGTAWEKIDNTDQVASVNGYTGVVVLSNTDVGAPPTSLTISAGTGLSGGGSLAANRTISIANTTVTAAPYGTASAVPTFTVNGQGQLTAASDVTIAIANTQVSGLGTMSTQNANSVAITGGSINGTTIGATTATTGAFTTLGGTTITASTKVATPFVDAVSSAGGALRNASGTSVIQWGVGGSTNSSVDGSINLNGTNAQIDISPTGTGHVHINPTGIGSVEINPTSAGTINNMAIGGTTPRAGAFTTLTASTAIGIASGGTGQTTANAAFNALAPSQTGNSGKYLTTDGTDTSWASNPLGTVTSVAASVPSFLSIAGSPITTSGTLAISLSGTALPTTSGGTGLTSFTANGVAYASSSSALTTGSALTFDGSVFGLSVPTGVIRLASSTGTNGAYFYATNTGGDFYFGRDNSTGTTFGTNSAYSAVLYSAGAYPMVFFANATESMRLTSGALSTSSGVSLGVGTSPSAKFDVYQSYVSDATNQQRFRDGTGSSLNFGGYDNANKWIQAQDSTGIAGYYNISLNPLGGNVGIGTSLPQRKLSIANGGPVVEIDPAGIGSANPIYFNYNRTTSVYTTPQYWALAHNWMVNGGTSAMLLDSAGNLGLGTPSSAWSATYKAIQIGQFNYFAISAQTAGACEGNLTWNAYSTGNETFAYKNTNDLATRFRQSGQFSWHLAGLGTAGDPISFTQAMTLTASGNLGIGINLPVGRLHVVNSSDTCNVIVDGQNAANKGALFTLRKGGADTGYIGQASVLLGGGSTSNDLLTWVEGAFSQLFYTNSVERARITSTGVLAVNYPSAVLADGNFVVYGSNGTGQGSANTVAQASFIEATSGNAAGLWIGAMTNENTAVIGTRTATGNLAFQTYNGAWGERMRLTYTGNLLVGLTSNYSACAGKISVISSSGSTATPTIAVLNPDASAAFVAFSDTATVFGSITRSISAVLYNTTSDQRLKENIQNAESASNLIDSLQVRQFDWKADGNHQRYGFVAQELVTVAPEAVYQPNDADAMMAVDYSKLVPMLVKEIQSLRARVLQLETN